MGVFQRKVSESPRKVQNVRQLTTKIRQEVFQKECFLLDLFTYVITSFDSLERMVTIMKRFYTAESVTEGHPDKLCDLIADSILDACLKEDENSRVACEVLATKGNIIVAGEITSRFEPQVFEIIKKVLESAGYEAEESKKRTHRLCQIGGAVESVLGCPIEEEDLPKLIGFLKRQETNGKFFSKAMQKEPLTDMEEV